MHSAVPWGIDQDEGEVESVGSTSVNVRVRKKTGGGEGLRINAVLAPTITVDEAIQGDFLCIIRALN